MNNYICNLNKINNYILQILLLLFFILIIHRLYIIRILLNESVLNTIQINSTRTCADSGHFENLHISITMCINDWLKAFHHSILCLKSFFSFRFVNFGNQLGFRRIRYKLFISVHVFIHLLVFIRRYRKWSTPLNIWIVIFQFAN